MFGYKIAKRVLILGTIFAVATSSMFITTNSFSKGFGFKGITKHVTRNIVRGVGRGAGRRSLRNLTGIKGVIGLAVGAALLGAPHVFQKDFSRRFKNDLRWSGCTRCRKRRVVVVPDRDVPLSEQAELKAQVKEDTKELQRALKALALYRGRIDGDYGRGTVKAVKKFQKSIDADQTGTMVAEQRSSLFANAALKGMVRKEYAASVETVNGLALQNAALKVPGNFRLVKSQFKNFTTNYLKAGSLSSVTAAKIRKNGVLEIVTLEEFNGENLQTRLIGDANNLFVTPHNISDKWAKLVFFDPTSRLTYPLNVLDSFRNSDETNAWIAEAREKITILAKITGRGKTSSDIPNGTPIQVASAERKSQKNAAKGCREKVYISFSFPKGEKPISHYNITPPKSTLMMDNGDSTAYFTGQCIEGEYGYKYVYNEHSNDKKNWKTHVREGSFKLASNSEQCQIDLLGDNSTKVTCF